MELEFRLANTLNTLNVSSKVRLQYFLHLEKNKEIKKQETNEKTKYICVEISKHFRRFVVSLPKVCRSKIFVT